MKLSVCLRFANYTFTKHTYNPAVFLIFRSSEPIRSLSPPAGMKVLLVDQWIETGGTMKAAIQLVEQLGATVVGAFRCLHHPPSSRPS